MDAGSFPVNAVTRPADIATRVMTVGGLVLAIVTFPMSIGGRPADIASRATTIDCAVLTLASLPMAAVTFPTAINCLVLTTATLPNVCKIKKMQLFSLFLKDSGFLLRIGE